MSVEPIRVGLVGAGRATRRLSLPILQAIPEVEVVAVCNERTESAQQVAAEFGIGEVVRSWEALVEKNDVDAIWIGTPPVMHAPVAIAALDAGKHVFCQARMARDLAEARMMLAAAERRPDLVAMLSPPPSGMRAGRFFSQLLADGYVGTLRHFQLVADDDMFADPVAPPHWRQRREVTGLNVLSVGIYAEVIQRWLGAPKRLHARTRVCVPERTGVAIEVPDVVQVSGEWDGGLIGSLEWSGVALFAPEPALTVYGSEGTLEYNFATDVVRGAQRGASELQVLAVPPALEASWTVEHDFITAIRSGGHPEPSFATGVGYMQFTEAVHLSASSGREIVLPL